MFSKRIAIALMLGFFGCQGEEGCAGGAEGGVTRGKSCATRCRHACETIYGDHHDGVNAIDWCFNDCNRENCLGQDAGRLSLDTGETTPYDRDPPLDAGVMDQGPAEAGTLSPCVTDCLEGVMYPECSGDYDCCNLYCNS